MYWLFLDYFLSMLSFFFFCLFFSMFVRVFVVRFRLLLFCWFVCCYFLICHFSLSFPLFLLCILSKTQSFQRITQTHLFRYADFQRNSNYYHFDTPPPFTIDTLKCFFILNHSVHNLPESVKDDEFPIKSERQWVVNETLKGQSMLFWLLSTNSNIFMHRNAFLLFIFNSINPRRMNEKYIAIHTFMYLYIYRYIMSMCVFVER